MFTVFVTDDCKCACVNTIALTQIKLHVAGVTMRARLDAEMSLGGVVSRDLQLLEFLQNVIVRDDL